LVVGCGGASQSSNANRDSAAKPSGPVQEVPSPTFSNEQTDREPTKPNTNDSTPVSEEVPLAVHDAGSRGPIEREGTVEDSGTTTASDSGSEGLACINQVALASFDSEPRASADEVACCREHNQDALGQVQLETPQETLVALAQDPSFVNCCRAIIQVPNGGVDPANSDELRYACCDPGLHDEEAARIWEHSYCTPWGPPVPPSLDYLSAALV
jgi:hypothetical protein